MRTDPNATVAELLHREAAKIQAAYRHYRVRRRVPCGVSAGVARLSFAAMAFKVSIAVLGPSDSNA